MAAAEGIHRVINTRMAEGIRLVSVRRGVDPRRFAILSFGGAAGLHVTDVARQLGVRRVIVPRLAAVLSAWGMLACDLRCEIARTHISDASRLDAAKLRAVFREMEEEGRTRLRDASHTGPVRVQRSADMRYGEQIFEVNVALDGLDLDSQRPRAADGACIPSPTRGALHVLSARSGGRAGERTRRCCRRAAGTAAGAEPTSTAIRCTARPPQGLPRPMARSATLCARSACSRADHCWFGSHKITDHDYSAASGGHRTHDDSWLARHRRGLTCCNRFSNERIYGA